MTGKATVRIASRLLYSPWYCLLLLPFVAAFLYRFIYAIRLMMMTASTTSSSVVLVVLLATKKLCTSSVENVNPKQLVFCVRKKSMPRRAFLCLVASRDLWGLTSKSTSRVIDIWCRVLPSFLCQDALFRYPSWVKPHHRPNQRKWLLDDRKDRQIFWAYYFHVNGSEASRFVLYVLWESWEQRKKTLKAHDQDWPTFISLTCRRETSRKRCWHRKGQQRINNWYGSSEQH